MLETLTPPAAPVVETAPRAALVWPAALDLSPDGEATADGLGLLDLAASLGTPLRLRDDRPGAAERLWRVCQVVSVRRRPHEIDVGLDAPARWLARPQAVLTAPPRQGPAEPVMLLAGHAGRRVVLPAPRVGDLVVFRE